uniref:Putative glycosyltransferase n=1 Tax=viral metagenome TaxID=1070528 RepID=A0A6H1ZJU4_9ZZZZ
MRILHYWDGRRGVPRRLQIDFVKKLANLCTLHVYGKNEIEKDISPIKYQGSRNIQEIADELKSDILLIPEYVICRGIPGLNKCRIPIVMMEVDFYATDSCDQDFYKKNNIRYIISRAPISFEDQNISSVWLPFSVADSEFYTDPDSDFLVGRKNKVTFVGSGPGSSNIFYRTRIDAINLLNKTEYFDYIGVRVPDYVKFLKEYIGALSCSFPPLRFPPAKTWEIMACGTALLTTDFYYKNILFGKDECFFVYKENLSDLVEKVKEITNDTDKVKEYTKKAIKIIQNRHLDSHRILELYCILKEVHEDKKLTKIWGI